LAITGNIYKNNDHVMQQQNFFKTVLEKNCSTQANSRKIKICGLLSELKISLFNLILLYVQPAI